MEMSPEAIKALLDAFDRSDWRSMTITIGADRLHVSRDPSADGAGPVEPAPAAAAPQSAPEAPAPAPAAPEPAAPAAPPRTDPAPASAGALPADVPASGTVIESPSVGLFWRAPAPGAPPFVEVGQHVAAGDTVAIVEVMKLMNHVVSPVEGVVHSIFPENGAPVEFGQPLAAVDPEA
jgi:acetyl-CoA carboxylase biotin carboxyl carrier protein